MDALFIHGINVRGEEAENTRATIEGHLQRRIDPHARVGACVWGNELGAQLRLGGKTIPTYETARAPGSEIDSARLQLLWADLYDDPLSELAALAQVPTGATGFRAPSAAAAASAYAAKVAALKSSGELAALLTPCGWTPLLASAVDEVARSPVLATLITSATDLSTCTLPAARAIYAGLHQRATAAGWPPLTARHRDAFIANVEQSLGKPMGVISWYANRYARRQRGALMDRVVPIVGDLIVYQGKGQQIRERIAVSIGECESPVCVFGHSLGGIAVVDTLLERPDLQRKVSQLFTMGTQVGFFHEVGALIGLKAGEQLPSDFPPWYSFYDHADIISFLAEPAFPGRVKDIRVESEEPFPASHSAYWNSSEVWTCVEAILTK